MEECLKPNKKIPQAGDKCPNHPNSYVLALSTISVKPFCGECDWYHAYGSCNGCAGRVTCLHWEDYRTRYMRFWEFCPNLGTSYADFKKLEEKIRAAASGDGL